MFELIQYVIFELNLIDQYNQEDEDIQIKLSTQLFYWLQADMKLLNLMKRFIYILEGSKRLRIWTYIQIAKLYGLIVMAFQTSKICNV